VSDEVLDDADTTGADLTYHYLPEKPAWVEALRSPGFLWVLGFFAINYLALGLAMGVHGAGFDDCEIMPTSSDRRMMALIAVVAVVVPAGLALWRLRRWARLAALGSVALSGAAWFILASDSQNCG
jgi:hypothetical protein